MNKFIIATIALAAMFAAAFASPYGGYGGGVANIGYSSSQKSSYGAQLSPIALKPQSLVNAQVQPQLLVAEEQHPVARASAASQSVDLQPGSYSILAVPSYKYLSYDPIVPVRTAISVSRGANKGYSSY